MLRLDAMADLEGFKLFNGYSFLSGWILFQLLHGKSKITFR